MAVFVLFLIAGLVLYRSDLGLGFFSVDDPDYVINNPWIRGFSGRNLSHILTAPYFANYSPSHLLSYSLDYVVAGLSPGTFHLSSNLWAGLVAGFVFLVALALTGRHVVAVSAAMLFVVHPVHVEAVAWISSRKDLVAAAFVLPSLLAYLRYRRGGTAAIGWYVASALLYLIAVGGKLSVATFPAVLLAFDLFIERRPLVASLTDKLPFLLLAGVVAMVVASAQPSMGHHPNPFVLSASLLQNLWLLSGFGRYVIYRVPPDSAVAATALQIVATICLIAIFAAPLLLRRRSPLAAMLAYWVLFTMIPSQVLSFTHPVTDRYLFLPSVAVAILIAWAILSAGGRLGRPGTVAASAILMVISLLWGRATLSYLAEWHDPRSVWYSSSRKSEDPGVYQALGGAYLEAANRLGVKPRGKALPEAEARALAAVVWAGDPRLSPLLGEWREGRHGGAIEKMFQGDLWTLALEAFDHAFRKKGTRVMPALYYNRGLILMDRGDLEGARKEFLAAIDEASRETFVQVRTQITVYSQTDLGIITLKTGDHRGALRWFQMAEEEQKRSGGNWVPELTATRQRLEEIVAKLPEQ